MNEGDSESAGDGAGGGLTIKQRQVLDLLIQHKTSKQISRELGISPHTVDQRIMLARGKLGVASRGEVAQAYRSLLAGEAHDRGDGIAPIAHRPEMATAAPAATYEKSIYQSSYLAVAGSVGHIEPRSEAVARIDAQVGERSRHRVLPEMFDGPNGTLLRLGAMAGIAVSLMMIALAGLSMFAELSHLLDR